MAEQNNPRGSCLCGVITLRISEPVNSVGACHCNMCRKWGGGPLFAIECKTNVSFSGGDAIGAYSSSDWAERGFCTRCGTHLFYRLKGTGEYFIPAGLLDSDVQLQFDHQVFIDEKPAFYCFANETTNKTGAEIFAEHGAE